MKIAVLTPTGDRRRSLLRQAHYITRSILPQGTRTAVWLIADDGNHPLSEEDLSDVSDSLPKQWVVRYIVRRPAAHGVPTLLDNMRCLLSDAVDFHPDIVYIWEDDDWYSPTRLVNQAAQILGEGDIAGSSPSVYYHVPLRVWRTMRNTGYASLFETAISGRAAQRALDFTHNAKGDGRGYDAKLWQHFQSDARSLSAPRFAVGIKGLPGRPGIGCGHTPKGSGWTSDPDAAYLKELLGEEDAMEVLEEGGGNK